MCGLLLPFFVLCSLITCCIVLYCSLASKTLASPIHHLVDHLTHLFSRVPKVPFPHTIQAIHY